MYSVARIPDGRIRILGQDENQQQVNVYLNPLDALELSILLADEAKRVLAHSPDLGVGSHLGGWAQTDD